MQKKMVLRNFRLARRLRVLSVFFFITLSSLGNDVCGLKRHFTDDAIGVNKIHKSVGLFPSIFNVALKADIYANATCGEDRPETFCKPSESSRCGICDVESHNISNVLIPGSGKWWQSPTLAQGDRFEYVTITLDLKQVYQIENINIKAANSPRPASWVLERSLDGDKFQPWQYYAASHEECWTKYLVPHVTKTVHIKDDEVICTSMYSRQTPMENGKIYTHLINGRIGAHNHSETLQEFTQARYVRLSLQGLQRSGDIIADKRKAFYSIKEISIGGRCLCSGHASRCRFSPRHGRQECECERNTCGGNCDRCCPMYNQVLWQPGTLGKGFQCEKCNCNNHANACRYDFDIASQYLSMDTRGQFRGGGVCIDCTDHTTGINCEKCQVGYYRPNGVLPDNPKPCIPCDHCYLGGSTGYCTPDSSHPGKVAGSCDCKTGYSGYKCDQCAAGYRQFPDCIPCPCDSRGILPSHDCEGDCLCKVNVEGEFCDRCKSGYFALTRDNLDGCTKCDCFGITDECKPAKLKFESITNLDGWRITDINGSAPIVPNLDPASDWLTITSFEIEYESYFWFAPKIYLGNRLSSYGSNLTFTASWVIMRGDTSGKPTTDPNVIIVGKNGMKIACGQESYMGQEARISVILTEHNWYHLRTEINDAPTTLKRPGYRGDSVTREQMLRVLADIKYLMIRAKYHSEQVEGSFLPADLPIGERSYDGDVQSLVEQCNCPEGYAGLSCENCAWGYVKVFPNGSDHQCVKCGCNNHAGSCDLSLGECKGCEHHTTGLKCERCAPGYYGDPSKGSPTDCKPCACPLVEPSNQFSPSCQLDDPKDSDSNYVCTQCPIGYTGDHCESCDIGYFGDPMKLGDTCKLCPCNGGTCDQITGRCLECRGNTDGWKCDKCKEAHYGDPLEQNCTACSCDPLGSSSTLCDTISGQCLCKPFFTGRDCSTCVIGYGNVTAGCLECNCGSGAIDEACDPSTGSCFCLPGVGGNRCEQCEQDHYGLSNNGCLGCQCSTIGSISTACDIVTGQCKCKSNVVGRQCNQCEVGYWGIATGTGCVTCNCNAVGSLNMSCDYDTGQCQCRPGVGGKRCDTCQPGYYGFSQNGCQICDPCEKLGHICDQDTGRCVCPRLTFGEHCDRCRPDSYGLMLGIGCKACLCGSGSTKSQCDMNGQCSCRTGFTGLKCDQCASGYYGYPRCKSCSCHGDGTVNCQDGICHCDHNGQCPCKENAIGRQCDECTTGTFGLDKNNPKGCTECFCFNRSTMCHQANLSWSQWRLPRPRALFINESINDILITNFGFSTSLSPSIGGLNVTNGLFIIPEDQGDIILPENLYFNYPLYWKLPSTFLGDKVVSYGGWLKFKIATNGGIALKTSLSYPLVQIQGNNKIILEYYQPLTVTDEQYKIRLHESLWQIQNRPDYRVSREVFMVALQNIQYILIKSSDFSDFEDVKLLEASIDAAVLKPTHSLALAMGIEICECPAEYNGTSCQDPSTGYYRWHNNKTITSTSVIGLVGEARLCQCNGRSEICDIETGYCLHCKFNTAGKHCDVCAESFYGHPDHGGCKPCPCPYTDKRFSNSCIVKDNDEVICHCKPGYSGPRCERCSYGFYGYPNISGGICTPCNCNPAGSASDECDEETGQCNCKFGSTGRDCSQCTSLRHVFINNVCTSCNDNCTGFLLNDLDKISLHLATETVHIAEGYIPPPWIKLTSINKSSNEFFDEITRLGHLKHRFKNIPWLDLKILMETFEELFKNAANSLGRAWDVKPKAEDIKNNIFNINVEIKNLRDLLDAITAQLTQYGDEVKKVGVKKSLKDALAILHYLKSVNFSQKYQQCQNDLDEATDYIEWLNSQLEIIQPLDKIKLKAAQYSRKLDDLKLYIQRTMETLFTYDSLFNKINNTYGGVKYQSDNINIINADTLGMIDEGIKLNEEAKIFIIDSNNNFENFQDLKTKLEDGTKKLQEKEGIAYRLNNEYREKYVDKANQHARKLSDYMNRYVALFVRTRNEASNPLKASQAYKNIVDSLAAARFSATRATSAAWESYYKIYPGGSQTKSLLDRATEMSEECTAQLENSQSLAIPLGSLQNKWHTQKHAVLDVKNSLNSTGIKDNLINMKLRELKSGCERRKDRIVEVKLDHQILIDSVLLSEKLINDYKEGIASGLRPQLHELKREGDSKISLASEKLTEAQSYIKKADAKLISLSHAAEKRQIEFGRWNRTLAEKLNKLKNKISEARNTADGIRISLKSVEGKKCFRSYRLKTIQPSTTTSIVMTLALTNHRTEGALFYLASGINDDFVALELFEGKIRFLWNVGGGTGVVTHPEILESGDPQTDNNWYRIQAERIRNTATLSIQKEVSASEKYLTVTNSTNPEFGRFDVTNGDRIWLGGMPTTQRRPAELMAQNGLPGCIHHVIFDHKHIGIWNFFTTAPDKSCKACVEGAEKAKNDIAYSFNGEGYAVRNRISSGPYNKYTFGVSINFKTFDENALIFLAINPENNQYIMIYLREGYIILHISYGGNISIEMSSKFKYNNGNWTQVDAFRQYQLKKNIEKCSLSVNGENDKKIGAPTPQPTKEDIPDLAQTKYYIGGVPPSFDSNNLILPSEISFLGCMSNINIQEGYDPMAEQYYGVEAACTNRPLKVVGFYGDGYLEYRSFTFKKISSIINFSFRSTQEEAALLLSTFEGQNNRYQNLENYDETTKNIYYSVAIVHGQIHVRLNAGSGELILQSNNTYNDGKYHIVSISKRRKEIELRVDDAYQASGKLPSSVSIKAPEFGGLYFGGLPAFLNNTKLIGSVLPLYGAIRDAIFNDDILRFDEAVSFNRALIGRAGPNIGKDVPTYIPSASLSRSLSSQPEGCQKVPYYSLEPGALKFGDKSHSHTQLYLNFKKFWEKKFVIEFDFRTYYPNGLLFITPGIKRKHYLMVIIRDSQLVLMVKSKQKKEILFKTPFNDGNWHRINIDHDGRKLTMVVDSQTPRTIKVPKKIGLESMMYIGGMPESGTPFPDQVVAKLETLKGCIRGLRVNGNIYDMVGSTSRAVSVGQCFSDVESGAYFQDDAYAIYKRNFELGAVLELQLEFRTSELSGVLLSITATNESPSLSLEINNGKVVMSRDLGDKSPLSVEQQFMSPYTVCDNQWHRIHAIFNNEELALKVDDLDQKYGLPANIDDHLMASTTSSSLYIGGLPAAAPKGTLVTRDHFNGCIRNVMIDTERRDWTDMAELHNVHLCSCPIQ